MAKGNQRSCVFVDNDKKNVILILIGKILMDIMTADSAKSTRCIS
jgi:hypothetical protein